VYYYVTCPWSLLRLNATLIIFVHNNNNNNRTLCQESVCGLPLPTLSQLVKLTIKNWSNLARSGIARLYSLYMYGSIWRTVWLQLASACFGWRVRSLDPQISHSPEFRNPHPTRVAGPHKCTYRPNGVQSVQRFKQSARMWKTDRRHINRQATEKCVAIGGLAVALQERFRD